MSVEEVAEFAESYSTQVRAMKRPAKEEINALTMVASDYVDSPPFALAVVQVLERAIYEVGANHLVWKNVYQFFVSCMARLSSRLCFVLVAPSPVGGSVMRWASVMENPHRILHVQVHDLDGVVGGVLRDGCSYQTIGS